MKYNELMQMFAKELVRAQPQLYAARPESLAVTAHAMASALLAQASASSETPEPSVWTLILFLEGSSTFHATVIDYVDYQNYCTAKTAVEAFRANMILPERVFQDDSLAIFGIYLRDDGANKRVYALVDNLTSNLRGTQREPT